MKRSLRPEETRLWAALAQTVELAPGRVAPEAPPEPAPPSPPPSRQTAAAELRRPVRRPYAPPEEIEPRRRRRIIRGHDILDARLDLHGLDQDRARAALTAFLHRAQAEGVRAVLVITGKGSTGDGVLRRRAPEWLAEPGLRHIVAGYSTAERRHGGEGALYVALKRRHPHPGPPP